MRLGEGEELLLERAFTNLPLIMAAITNPSGLGAVNIIQRQSRMQKHSNRKALLSVVKYAISKWNGASDFFVASAGELRRAGIPTSER